MASWAGQRTVADGFFGLRKFGPSNFLYGTIGTEPMYFAVRYFVPFLKATARFFVLISAQTWPILRTETRRRTISEPDNSDSFDCLALSTAWTQRMRRIADKDLGFQS